jgi:hypothetical protein
MSEDHPLYLKPITLKDGRFGTIVEVFEDGKAFELELPGGLEMISPDDIAGTAGVIARHHPELARMERCEGSDLDLSEVSDEEFDAFMVMTLEERKAQYGDFSTISLTDASNDRKRKLRLLNGPDRSLRSGLK